MPRAEICFQPRAMMAIRKIGRSREAEETTQNENVFVFWV